MLIVKGNIFRNVSAREAEKLKAAGYSEVKKPAAKKAVDKNGADKA